MAQHENKGFETLVVAPDRSGREESHRVSGKEPLKMKVNDSRLVRAEHSGTSDPSVRVGPGQGPATSCPHSVPFDGVLTVPFSSLRVISPRAAFLPSPVSEQLLSFMHRCCGSRCDLVQSPSGCPVLCSCLSQLSGWLRSMEHIHQQTTAESSVAPSP